MKPTNMVKEPEFKVYDVKLNLKVIVSSKRDIFDTILPSFESNRIHIDNIDIKDIKSRLNENMLIIEPNPLKLDIEFNSLGNKSREELLTGLKDGE